MAFNLNFVSAGHFTSNGVWKHPTVKLSTYELIVMTEGEAHLFEDENHYTLKSTDAIFFKPSKNHGGFRESLERVSFLWFHMLPKDEVTKERLDKIDTVTDASDGQLQILSRQLLHRASYSEYTKEIKDASMTLLLLEYEFLSSINKNDEKNSRLINKIIEWIRINASTHPSVTDVAKEFSYNVDYITRYFHKSTGITLKYAIDTAIMNEIKKLLLTSDLSLKEIAAKTGFEDYKAFLKFFKYHENISPTEYRKSCYKTHTNNR